MDYPRLPLLLSAYIAAATVLALVRAGLAPLPVAGPFGGFHPVAIEPEELPRTAAAYSSIDALVIDRRLMSSLDQRGNAAAATSGAQGLALSRTPVDAHSILWPLDLGRVQHAPTKSQAWLLMRIGPSEQG